MQQQILQLLSSQVKELQAAYPHMIDDAAASEQVFKFFTHEADMLSRAVVDLAETMWGHFTYYLLYAFAASYCLP
jgi:hypothetical protein